MLCIIMENTLIKLQDQTKKFPNSIEFRSPYCSTADDWPKVLSLRTLLVRWVQHLVTYTKMFVCMSSFRNRLMTSSLISTNGVTALSPYTPFIKDY